MRVLVVKKSEPVQEFISGKVESIVFTLMEFDESIRQSGEYVLIHADSTVVGLGAAGSYMGMITYPTVENSRKVSTHTSSSYIKAEHLSPEAVVTEDEQGNSTYTLTGDELAAASLAAIKEWWGDTFGSEVGNHPVITNGKQLEYRIISIPVMGSEALYSFSFFVTLLTDPEQFIELVGLSEYLGSVTVNLPELVATILRNFDNPRIVAEIMTIYLHNEQMSQGDLSHMVSIVNMLVKPLLSVITGPDIEAALESVVKRVISTGELSNGQ